MNKAKLFLAATGWRLIIGVFALSFLCSSELRAQTCGTVLSCSTSGDSFRVNNSGTGSALTGNNTSSGNGVTGLAVSATGVFGSSSTSDGVQGQTTSGIGVYGVSFSTSSGIGVEGVGNATFGVEGQINSTAHGKAGVFGIDSAGRVPGYTNTSFYQTGVRGESVGGFGVFGLSSNFGVVGAIDNSSGTLLADGILGAYNVTANGRTQNWAVYAAGDIGSTGTKYFIAPHPTDAGKVIKYIALEGPEAGTYFRGTARTINGEATIEVPEDFRLVTEKEGLTAQLTPVGGLAMMAVVSQDLNRIIVRSSQDVTFHYLVQGVRSGYRNLQPIVEEDEFVPRSAGETLPASLNEESQRRLIANGTYNEDGTVNLQTAKRMGWFKKWTERDLEANAVAGNEEQ